MICASAFFHTGLFLLLTVQIPGMSEPPERDTPERAFSLVNVALLEPAAPELPLSRPLSEPPPLPEPPPPEPLPVSGSAPAENYIITEEEPAAAAPEARQGPGPSVQAESGGPGGRAAGSPGGTAEAAALTAEYVKRNYNYIQRRIRDRLVYPSPARRAGIQGVTEISFIIHEDGRVGAVTVRAGSGHAVLDEAAVETILAAAPFPAPPAAARIVIPIAFRLR
jgi:protein TonB